MTGPAVLTAVVFVAICLAYAFCEGTAELDDLLRRWKKERRDREAMRRRAVARPTRGHLRLVRGVYDYEAEK